MINLGIYFLIFTQLNSNFTFLNPEQKKAFKTKIEYDLAPFGKFPYGRELFGYLHYEKS